MVDRQTFLDQKRPGNTALLVALTLFIAILFAVGYSRTSGLIERAEQRGKEAAEAEQQIEKNGATTVAPTNAPSLISE